MYVTYIRNTWESDFDIILLKYSESVCPLSQSQFLPKVVKYFPADYTIYFRFADMIREILISYNTRHFYYADKYFSTYYKWDRVKKRLVASNKTHIWVVRLTGMLHFAYVTAQLWTILLNSSHTFLERWTGALVSLTYLFELGFRAEWKADPRVLQLVNCVVQGHTLNHGN